MIQYDPHRWSSHLFDIRGSMLREILLRVGLCVAWSVVVWGIHSHLYEIQLPLTFHTLTGVALSLLLVFRTNASYDRFWEGRKLWGAIVNDSRNLGRMAAVSLADAPDLRRNVVAWTSAFTYAAMNNLRGKSGLGPQERHLPAAAVERVLASSQPPLAAAQQISQQLFEAQRRGIISDYLLVAMESHIRALIDHLGGCQRIHGTPLPFAYVVHLRRALIIYCYTLPLAIVGQFGVWTIFWTLLVAYMFAGIEEIGVEIEDPFGEDDNDLPLDRFCERIERETLEAIGEPATPPGHVTPPERSS